MKKTTAAQDKTMFNNSSISSTEDTYIMEYDNDIGDQSDCHHNAVVASTSSSASNDEAQLFDTQPKPLPNFMWSEPDANSFVVRGKHYKRNKKKSKAGQSVFRLITVDMIEVDTPLSDGIGAHPQERMQHAKKNNNNSLPPYVIIINIVIPGPPNYHLVMYYAVDDMGAIDGSDGTPFSKLANQFFFGTSDAFRDQTFKLIPRVIEGNFVVRRAVGSNTPVIMGTKLKQRYVHGEGYFELILDVGSSSIAANVVWLSLGYAKSLVVDMAFLLEGNDETTLPERVMGCCRLSNVDVESGIRFCKQNNTGSKIKQSKTF